MACWVPVAGLGIVFGLSLVPLGSMAAFGVLAGVVGARVAAIAHEHAPDDPATGSVAGPTVGPAVGVAARRTVFLAARPPWWVAVSCGLGAVVLHAWFALFGAAVWPVLVAAVCTSPSWWTFWLSRIQN
ncbi:MAG: hypothetical protein WA966_05365 [Ornithinimicrobium sp.]